MPAKHAPAEKTSRKTVIGGPAYMTVAQRISMTPLPVNRVVLDVSKNAMEFWHDDDDMSFKCGDWGLCGDLYDRYLDAEDRAHWAPFAEIPTVIAYVNYQLYATRVNPANVTGEKTLQRILDEQIENGGDIGADLRRSIDGQIAALVEQDVKSMLRKQEIADFYIDNEECFATKAEWLHIHGGPDVAGFVF